MRKAGLCATALVVSLALVASAQGASNFTLKGSIVGNERAAVTVKLTKKDGRIGRILGMKFQRVPVNCDDGSVGAITGTLGSFPVRGKDFTRKGPIRGIGINNGFLRVAGKFSRGGKVAKGNVRFSFKNDAGAGCGTDDVAWKATK